MECIVSDIPIYYEVYGEGRPILMLHGGYLDHHHMVSEMEPLFESRSGWQRIYLDLPGHGRTPAPEWLTNNDKVLDVLLEFVEQVIPDKQFAIAGSSRGGYLTQGIVYKRPEQVAGVLLIVPAFHAIAPTELLPEAVTLVEDETLTTNATKPEARAIKEMVVQSAEALQKIREHRIPAIFRADRKFQSHILQNEHYEYSFDVKNLPHPFTNPALIITGRHDAIVGYQEAWQILESYPRATFAVLDNAGHLLGVEQEGLFRALANEWLDRVEVG